MKTDVVGVARTLRDSVLTSESDGSGVADRVLAVRMLGVTLDATVDVGVARGDAEMAAAADAAGASDARGRLDGDAAREKDCVTDAVIVFDCDGDAVYDAVSDGVLLLVVVAVLVIERVKVTDTVRLVERETVGRGVAEVVGGVESVAATDGVRAAVRDDVPPARSRTPSPVSLSTISPSAPVRDTDGVKDGCRLALAPALPVATLADARLERVLDGEKDMRADAVPLAAGDGVDSADAVCAATVADSDTRGDRDMLFDVDGDRDTRADAVPPMVGDGFDSAVRLPDGENRAENVFVSRADAVMPGLAEGATDCEK